MESKTGQAAVVPSTNWLVRVYFTPLRDMVQGSLSARLDARREIAAAMLPAPLDAIIWRVVRKTRLWRQEQVDVARELVSHFLEGVSAGRTAEQLAEDFGNERAAARLIRKAKLRSRPLWWQASRLGWRTMQGILVASILAYALWSVRFYSGRPVVAQNYWQEVNAARRVDEADRAWPIYHEAIAKMVGVPGVMYSWQHVCPGDADWDDFVSHIELNQPSIELARVAARKPRLGAYLNEAAQASDWISLLGIDYGWRLETLHRFLLADARVAAVEGQADRAWEDIAATISLARQLQQPRAMLVEQFNSSQIFRSVLSITTGILAQYPDLFTESQLRDLAHAIAAYDIALSPFDSGTADLEFLDFLQRAYTEDGSGDGRITPEGVRLLDARATTMAIVQLTGVLQVQAPDDTNAALAADLLIPGVAYAIGSRRENREMYRSLLDQAARAHQGPAWTWDPRELDAAGSRLANLRESPIDHMRYLPVLMFSPYVDGLYETRELEIQSRDATQVIIGLVLWHRRSGTWPESLNQLVPEMLPAVPLDRMDGQPLRYRVRDGQPVVYSVGMDRIDDGGCEGSLSYHRISPLTPERLAQMRTDENKGDWILWPPSTQPKDEPPPTY